MCKQLSLRKVSLLKFYSEVFGKAPFVKIDAGLPKSTKASMEISLPFSSWSGLDGLIGITLL
jgi:hypothetical protein